MHKHKKQDAEVQLISGRQSWFNDRKKRSQSVYYVGKSKLWGSTSRHFCPLLTPAAATADDETQA